MTLAFQLGKIGELGAGVAGRAIVDVLDLACLEAQLDMQLGLLEHRLHGGQRGRGLVVQPLAAQVVAGMDLAQRQPRVDRAVGTPLEDRCGEGGGLVGLVLGMAVVRNYMTAEVALSVAIINGIPEIIVAVIITVAVVTAWKGLDTGTGKSSI